MAKRNKKAAVMLLSESGYDGLLTGISELLERARRMSARSVNSILTATYWEIDRRIVEFEQGGKARAEYGEELVEKLAHDLRAKHGRGFSVRNVWNMKAFYLGWENVQTPSAQFEGRVRFAPTEGEIVKTASAESSPRNEMRSTASSESAHLPVPVSPRPGFGQVALVGAFPLSWSHYVRLLSVTTARAQAFCEAEAKLLM
ncbi:MAG: DUF1016 N-terminal domain-containing protein [Thermoguttaceae bacterium]